MRARDLLTRLRSVVFRKGQERELDDELQFHLDMQTRKHVGAGLDPTAARQRAHADFGSVDLVKEDARDVRRSRPLEELLQDIRYAIRGTRRTPMFALTVIFTIAVGLGLNTTVFTIFNAYVLRPFDVRDPQALYEFTWLNRAGRGQWLTWDEYTELNRNRSVFSETIGQRFLLARFDGQPAFGELVSGNYFQMLGVGAALGRTLLPEDAAAPATAPVIVLSHAAWTSRFGGDSTIVGKTIIVRGVALQVIGVARAGFGGVDELPRDFWVPLTMITALDPSADLFGDARAPLLTVVGRLASGVTPARARAALTGWSRAVTERAPESRRAQSILFESRATATSFSPELLKVLSPIIVAFALVLVIACANVANMMLARGMARQREIGIRLSLGAARSRLVRQLLTESIMLALPSGGLAFVISSAALTVGVRAMFATVPAEFGPYLKVMPLAPDGRVFAFILLAAVTCAVLFGLTPALQATRASVVQAAKGNFDAEHRPSRLRNALVVAQVCAASLLLICSGILYRSAHRLQSIESGVQTHNLLQVDIVETSRARVLAELRARPTVDAIAVSQNAPLDGSFPSAAVSAATASTSVLAYYNVVSSEYFDVLAIPLINGRMFTRDEEAGRAPVVIVSQSLAARLWPGGRAVGQTIALAEDPSAWRSVPAMLLRQSTVIGVARNAVSGVLAFGSSRPVMYFPATMDDAGSRLIVHVRGDQEQVRRTLEADMDRTVPGSVQSVHKLDELVAGSLYPFRVAYWVSSAVGAIALLLTLTGIYGVLSYVVTQRSREIGIRLALGSSARGVVGLVMRQSVRLALIGLGAGSLLAVGASNVIGAQLEFMDLFDGPAYIASAAIVVCAALAAALVPSRRAARIDPVVMLRQD
jgi:predicted permease